jgi:hypothetical protein
LGGVREMGRPVWASLEKRGIAILGLSRPLENPGLQGDLTGGLIII